MTQKRYDTTYANATRVAEVVFWLLEPRRTVTVEEISASFEVSPRTAKRYLAALRAGAFDGVTHPYVLELLDRSGEGVAVTDDPEVSLRVRIPENRIAKARLMRAAGDEPKDSPAGALLPLYLALTLLQQLEGVVEAAKLREVWRALAAGLAPHERVEFSDLERKFYAVPNAPKRYEDRGDILETVVEAVIRREVLDVGYYGVTGEGKNHRFEPYTLASYKGGLYLLGKSDRHDDGLIYLAVERIDTVEVLRAESGAATRFKVPRDFSPATHFQGTFGLIQGEEVDVDIEIQTRETEARLKERLIHPSQKIRTPRAAEKGADGYRKARMQLRVRGTVELRNWLLSYGPYLRVIAPESLRDDVVQSLDRARALY